MPAKNLLRVSDKDTYSHIYNKGIENRLIFNDNDDYQTFISFINEYLTSPLDQTTVKKAFTVNGRTFHGTPHQPKNYFDKVQLISYSLMPTHFHLVLHQRQKGSIESFLRSLSTRYSMYFNKKHKRKGSLFEGAYKSVQLNADLLAPFVNELKNKHNENTHYYLNKAAIVSFPVKEADKNALDSLMIESKDLLLERRNLEEIASKSTGTPLKVTTTPVIPSVSIKQTNTKTNRWPEYMGLSFAFIFLTVIGLVNIKTSDLSAKTNKNTEISTFSKPITIASRFSDTASQMTTDVLAATESGTPTASTQIESSTAVETQESDPTDLLYTPIQITEGANMVNIYNAPNITSAVHKTAKEGEQFEGVPIDENWYEVRLGKHTSGYIESIYIKLDQKKSE